MNTATTQTFAHPFEKTIGAGPYTFIGMVSIQKPTENNPHDNYKECWEAAGPRFVCGMGTCAHCGMAIMNVCLVKTGNGDVYGVGTDCIGKITCEPQLVKAVNKALKERNRAKRIKTKLDKRAKIVEVVEARYDEFAKLPHPNPKMDHMTFVDYVDFMLGCCGAAGINRLYKEVMAK